MVHGIATQRGDAWGSAALVSCRARILCCARTIASGSVPGRPSSRASRAAISAPYCSLVLTTPAMPARRYLRTRRSRYALASSQRILAFSGKLERSKPSVTTSNSARSGATSRRAVRSQHAGNRKRSLGLIRRRGGSAKHNKSRPPAARSNEGDAEDDHDGQADRGSEEDATQRALGGLGHGHKTSWDAWLAIPCTVIRPVWIAGSSVSSGRGD